MAIPNAPLEGAGDKILFGVYNNAGANAAALIHAVVTRTLNTETIGWLATATHADLATFAAGDPVALAAGYDGTLVRKMLVDASGRQIVSGEIVDNTAFTDGTTRVVPSGFIFDDVAGTALTENDAAAARVNANRAVVITIEDTTTRASRVRALGTIPGATDVGLVVRPVGQIADNGAFTDGTTAVLPTGFVFDEVAGTALTENDVAAARIDSKRSLVGVIEDATTRGQRAAVSAAGSLAVDVRPSLVRVAQTPTVSSGSIYAAKDAIGGLLTFANAARAAGGTGTVQSVQVTDLGQQMADIDLVLFDRSVTAPTDNAAFDPSDAEAAQVVGIVKVVAADYADFSDNSVASKAVSLPYKLEAATTSLFGVLVSRGTPTYTSTSDVVVTLTVQQN